MDDGMKPHTIVEDHDPGTLWSRNPRSNGIVYEGAQLTMRREILNGIGPDSKCPTPVHESLLKRKEE